MNYPLLLKEIKDRIRQAQVRATLSANAEMLLMYWDVGRIIADRRSVEGWGTKIIQRLAQDIRNDLLETKGFSERNLKRMLAFHNEYKALSIMPTALAQLPIHASTPIRPTALAQFSPADTSNPDAQILQFVLLLPWAHNATLLGVKETSTRLWYMAQTLEHGWSHDFLVSQIKSNVHERLGKATTNFSTHLPTPQSALAQEVLKDPRVSASNYSPGSVFQQIQG